MLRDKAKTTITSIVATPVSVPLREQWIDVGVAQQKQSGKYILRAGTDRGVVGLGETLAGVSEQQLRRSAQSLLGIHIGDMHPAWLPIAHDRAYGGFELLVYDILGLAYGMPVHHLLGGRARQRVACRAPLLGSTAEDVAVAAQHAAERGFRAGVMHAAGHDIGAAVAAVRQQVGHKFAVIVQADGVCDSEQAARQMLAELAGHDVLAVEDALPHGQWKAYPHLRQNRCPLLSVSVTLDDESPDRRAFALDSLCAEVDGLMFNGPAAHITRMADVAHLVGRRCGLSGDMDLGILEAGRLHAAAASPGCVWFSDIYGRLLREHDLLARPLTLEEGEARAPTAPGLGVQLHVDAMEQYRTGPDLELARG